MPQSATAPTASTGACCRSWWRTPGALDNGDYVYLPGVRKALLEAADELDAVAVKPDGGLVKFTVKLGAMTDAERDLRGLPDQLLQE